MVDQIQAEMELNLHDMECAQRENIKLIRLAGGMDKMSDEQWLIFNNNARMISILQGRVKAMGSR